MSASGDKCNLCNEVILIHEVVGNNLSPARRNEQTLVVYLILIQSNVPKNWGEIPEGNFSHKEFLARATKVASADNNKGL